VSYEERDVAQDAQAREEMLRLSGRMAVPVIVIDSEVIVGFDQKTIEKKLKEKGQEQGSR
jgi:glutaredoxin 3